MTDYEELENGANPEPEDLEAFREAGKSIADTIQPTIERTMNKMSESVINSPSMKQAFTVLGEMAKQTFSQIETGLIEALEMDTTAVSIIKSFTPDRAANPYSKETYAMFTGTNPYLSEYVTYTNIYTVASDETKTRADEITGGGLSRLVAFMERLRTEHSALLAAVDAKELTLEELGITQDQLNEQKAYNFHRDMFDIYMFLYELKHTPSFSIVRSGEAVTGLLRVDKRSNQITKREQVDELSPVITTTHLTEGNFTMVFDDAALIKSWTPGAKKMFFILNRAVSASHYDFKNGDTYIAAIPLDEVMELRGMKNVKSARRTIMAELDTLGSHKSTYVSKNKTRSLVRVPLAGGPWGISDNTVAFTFSREAMRGYFNPRSAYISMNDKAYSIDTQKYPHAFNLYFELLTYSYTNAGCAQENKISVSNLIKRIPSLPNPKNVANRKETEKIIEPLENNLDALIDQGILATWEYTAAAGKTLTEKQKEIMKSHREGHSNGLDKIPRMPWKEAKNLYITWEFCDEDKEHRQQVIDRHKQRKLKAENEKIKAKAKADASEMRKQKAKDKKAGELEAIAEFQNKRIEELEAKNKKLEALIKSNQLDKQ